MTSKRRSFLVSFLPFLCLLSLVSSCASKKPNVPSNLSKVAVLNGAMAPGKEETRKSIVGYWFTSRDRFESGTANLLLADALSDELVEYPGIEVRPRSEIKTMFAQKERILSRSYGDYSPEERKTILSEINPTVYGESLGVDYVIVPKVSKARLVHNRFIHSWMGSADVEVEVYDVKSSELVYSWNESGWQWFSSTTGILEKLSEEFQKDAYQSDAFYRGLWGN